jgi:hypothetical protein
MPTEGRRSVEGMATTLEPYAARICWNSKNWVCPTGEAAKIESPTNYAPMFGFGHEEWLFNYQWVIGGWKYGFLQPVNKSLRKVLGETIDVRLYTISPHARWFYVGHIRQCEVLTEEVASKARAEFRRRGWLRDMNAQIRKVGGEKKGLDYTHALLVFNVRFRPKEATLYDPMIPVGAKDSIRRVRRYSLVHLRGRLAAVEKQWATRVGTIELRSTGKRRRAAIAPGEVNLVHGQLQNDLCDLLVKRYGKGAVVMEEGFADLKVRRRGKVTLIEVKSDSRPRHAIREALGQLLEYAYVSQREGEPIADLVVVGPGEMDGLAEAYLRHLRDERGLPIRYVCFRRGMDAVEL